MTAIYEPPTSRAAERRADRTAAAEQARADRAAAERARLEREQVQAQADLEIRRMEAEERRRDADAKAERDRAAAEAEQQRKAAGAKAKAQEKARRKAVAAARSAKRRAWLRQNAALPFVALVMVCSVVPAVISQVGALSDASVPLALAGLLAVMLEGGAWAVTFMGKAAENSGRPARKYRVGTWVAASLAAAINLMHGWAQYPHARWVAAVLALSSLFAVWIWDLYAHHGKAPSKAEKAERRARAKHSKERRRLHPEVSALADSIMAACHFGTVTVDEAFAHAWLALKGTAQLGVTPDIRAGAVQAAAEFAAAHTKAHPDGDAAGIRARLWDSVYTPTSAGFAQLGDASPVRPKKAAKAQVESLIPPAPKAPRKAGADGRRSNAGTPPRRTPGDTAPYSTAARAAARETALRTQAA